MGERAHTPGRGRPILFSAPMVRALLDGRKAQTRRIIKPQPVVHPAGNWSWDGRNGSFVGAAGTHLDESFPEAARFHSRVKVGDRLWVREAHALDGACAWYREGHAEARVNGPRVDVRWRSPIHMPRWAARLTLTVTDVRVQRLQEISRDDAAAEGLIQLPSTKRWVVAKGDQYFGMAHRDPRAVYEILWEEINGAGSWDANPWVAAYTFTVERRNIDAPATAAKTGGA